MFQSITTKMRGNKNFLRVLAMMLFFLCLKHLVYAQEATVMREDSYVLNGKVIDEDNKQGLIGVSVSLTGPIKRSTLSDINGDFSLRVTRTDVLSFSYLGYASKEIAVSEIKNGVVSLKIAPSALEEVVVIAYGTIKREEITGSLSTVSINDLQKAPVANFEQALAGRVAGVQVSSGEGQPGSGMDIVVRGGNSLTQSNSPLYVIDGFPVEDFNSASLNPDDISSITILKDAEATAVYGSRASNGVVVVQTKKGVSGQPSISYHGYGGIQNISNTIDMMDSYDYVKFMIERDPVDQYNKFITRPSLTLDDYKAVPTVDWQDYVFDVAYMQSHWLSLRGGNTQTKYNISTSIFDQDGIAPNSGFNRYQGRLSVDQKIGGRLDFSINANYSQDKNYGLLSSEQGGDDNSYSTYLMYQTWGSNPVVTNLNDIYDDPFVDAEEVSEGLRLFNPIVAANNQIRQQTRNNILVNAKLDYLIGGGFSFSARGGMVKRGTLNESFFNSKTYQGYPYVNNLRGVQGNYTDIQLSDWSNEEVLNYSKTIKKGHKINALVGVSLQGRTLSRYGYAVSNIVREEMGLAALQYGEPTNIIANRTKNILASYFTRVNYNIKGRYFFSGSFRADGSSKFASGNRWGYFPAGGVSWAMNKEPFMKKYKFISGAKLRLSYGATGNNRVGDFSQYSSIDILSDYYSFNNGIPQYGSRFDNLGSENLRWETTLQANIGYDLSLFNDRISFVADLYRKTTNDLLLNADLPGTSGFLNMYKNIGKINNDGLELSLTTLNIKKRNFSWESTFNISFNRNEVRELANNQENLMSRVNWTNAYNGSNLYVAQIGQSSANYYGYIWDGNYQYTDFDQNPDGSYSLKSTITTNGASRSDILPGDIKYVDVNGDKVVNDQDMVVIGRALPVHIGGFNNNFTYKAFALNVFVQWSSGNDIFNANRLAFEGNFGNRNINQYATYANRWSDENQNDTYFRTGGQGPLGMYSSRTIEDGSYLRMKTVQLSYDLPKSLLEKLSFKRITTYISGQDLLTWTNYSGIDPEVSVRNSALTPGFDYSAYPRAKTFTLGIKASL